MLEPELAREIPWPGYGLEWKIVETAVSDTLVLVGSDGVALEMAVLGLFYTDDVVIGFAEKLFIRYLFDVMDLYSER